MKAYYHDESAEDQRAPHDSGRIVTTEELNALGVLSYHFDDMQGVERLAKERGYVNRDVVNINPEAMGGVGPYEEKLKIFYSEHLHEDEEIRYILDGEGYFDVRDKDDKWIRCALDKGDLLILPAGIYHRFTTNSSDSIKAMRLFQQEPKWIPYNRPADDNEYRQKYLESYA
jgi:1,2-dihydroxy-3-keto-5-methylthiopentene dioxygenase